MDFSKRYDRDEFMKFLQNEFLPEDVSFTTDPEVEKQEKAKYIKAITKLGTCPSLRLAVYEARHTSPNDARVGLSKEIFRFMGNKRERRALVLFVPEENGANYRFSLISIDLHETEDGKIKHSYSNPRRYSYYLGEGIAYYTPNKYLNEAGRVKDTKDLTERFSVEVLTKAFYQELSDWYAWAVKKVRFPNKLDDPMDDDKFNAESTIRLVTRLIFVWFLKQKHLIPDEFFDEKYITDNLLENFNPNAKVDLFSKSTESRYYKAILQNLFFAMLNSPITQEGKSVLSERRFRMGRGDYDNNKLMRYEAMFKNPQLFVDLANRTVPFLNGGLFDCLDDKDNGNYIDGFSDRKEVQTSLIVPDYLFFGEEVGKNIDLSEWYGDKKKKKVSARGIIDILKRYNFTVEENTPFDQDVSLDPELLGKVFENLLASYNPETQTTARKQTGSFYTPREIVQYMVDESLVAHLKRTVGDELETEYRALLQYTDNEVALTDAQKKRIMQSLYECKVLDPACGSGAFPVGMLQQMVHILGRIDPDNTQWKEMLLDNAAQESREAFQSESGEERSERLRDIEQAFDEQCNFPDYARKLYLIENCLYGVDIQPIAIQISKLRFFISLVVDQKTTDDPVNNFGIRPLPNLEAKFVAGNTLIPLDKSEDNLGRTSEIIATEERLKEANHRIFNAKTVKTKRKWKTRLKELRSELILQLSDNGFLAGDAVNQLASWDMFDQNAAASFFDADWMFGVREGFDIVIGNPPYVQVKKGLVKVKYFPYSEGKDVGKQNMYKLFIECGYNLLTKSGVFVMIVQSSLMCDMSAAFTRELLLRKTSIAKFVEFPKNTDNINAQVFKNVLQGTCICIFTKEIPDLDHLLDISINNDLTTINNLQFESAKQIDILKAFPSRYEIPLIKSKEMAILNKIKSMPPLSQNISASYQGNINTIHLNKIRSLDPSDVFIVKGANIHRFYRDNDLYYGKYNDVTAPLIDKNKQAEAVIATQNITGTTDRFRIHATLVECKKTNIVFLDSVNILYLPNPSVAKLVVACLNSTVLDWLFRKTSTNNHCNMYELLDLPIPHISDTINKLIPLVDHMISQNGIDESCSQEINVIVYKLYKLTYDEVKTIDPATPITREEYEKEKIK